MKYFEILNDPDLHVQQRWHLESAVSTVSRKAIYCWPLVSGDSIDAEEFKAINFPIQYDGPRLSFTFASWIAVPIVHRSIAIAFMKLGEGRVRLLPCMIDGRDLEFEILVVEKKIACLDTKRSEVAYHTAEDCDEATDAERVKIGTIKYVRDLKVDTASISEADHIFRLAEDPAHLIVSEVMKDALKAKGISGVTFAAV